MARPWRAYEALRHPLPVSLLAFCLLLSSCARLGHPRAGWPGGALPDAGPLYQELVARTSGVRTLQGTAQVRIRTATEKTRFDAVLAFDRGGRVRLEALDFLGHVVFLGLFGPGGYLTYAVSENRFARGAASPEELRRFLGVALGPAELAALALGSPFFLPLEDPDARVSVDEGRVLLDVEGAGGGVRYLVWLDDAERPRKVLLMNPPAGTGLRTDIEVEFGRYREIDAIPFPFRIRVTADQGRFFEVDYDRVLLNDPLSDDLFDFTPPADAEEMTW